MRGEHVDGAKMFLRNPQKPSGVWLSLTGRPLIDETGERIGGTIVIRDISDLKQVEENLRQLNEQLEQRVERRTQALSRANHELIEKSQENELFVYSVSHDLRSPLVNLQGYSNEI